MRATYVMRGGKLVRKERAGPREVVHGRGSYVISDVMAPVKHMGTGQVLDSKSAHRAATKALGLVEVGTDPAVSRPSRGTAAPPIEQYVQRAIAQLESR